MTTVDDDRHNVSSLSLSASVGDPHHISYVRDPNNNTATFPHTKPKYHRHTSDTFDSNFRRSFSAGGTLVKRSSSLTSLRGSRRHSKMPSDTSSIAEESDCCARRSPRVAWYDSGRQLSDFELPANVVAQLEADLLHGNLRRDSFRSRSGTNNFVMNPLFNDGESGA